MPKEFIEIHPDKLDENVFNLIGEQWMLITAGTKEHFNTMTASWGTMGILWQKPVAVCFIRPQRFTYQFAESSGHYTLSFLEPGNREILKFCGTRSGRNKDKVKETGLEPRVTRLGNIYFEQCKLVLECRKLYADHLKGEAFIVPELIGKNYPMGDFHKFYIGEIVSCLVSG